MIGAARYFNPRYWARRYWPKLGAAALASPADAIGALTTDGATPFLGGATTFATLGGGLDADDLGGSLAASVLGGDLT
jgi:hypothetical protein